MKLSEDFLKKIARALEEEEEDIYTMTICSIDSKDIFYFDEKDRVRVQRIFKTLIKDTRRHVELLKLIVEIGER